MLAGFLLIAGGAKPSLLNAALPIDLELNVKKPFALLVIVAAIAMAVPSSRQRILTWLGPIGESGQRRTAERALGAIADDVTRAMNESGSFPQPGPLTVWLAQRDRDGEDPWGSAYYLELSADSFAVRSPGPDARLHTADDLRLARRRVGPDPGALIIDYQPAPPPSSASRTAKSRAMEAAERH